MLQLFLIISSNQYCQLTNNLYHLTDICYHFIILSGKVRVDCKSIATALIRDMDPTNARKLIQFVICRAACGHGGKHLWLRFDEANYDPFFNCVDFEWHIAKQCHS